MNNRVKLVGAILILLFFVSAFAAVVTGSSHTAQRAPAKASKVSAGPERASTLSLVPTSSSLTWLPLVEDPAPRRANTWLYRNPFADQCLFLIKNGAVVDIDYVVGGRACPAFRSLHAFIYLEDGIWFLDGRVGVKVLSG